MPRISLPIETERLTLRALREADLEQLVAFQSRPDVARYRYWTPRTEEEVRRWLERAIPEPDWGVESAALVLAAVERLGMRQEAKRIQNEKVKGEWADVWIYSILAPEWRQAKGIEP